MNRGDSHIEEAERDASPIRFGNYSHKSQRSETDAADHVSSASSTSTESYGDRGMSRKSTIGDADMERYLERHPTAVQRMNAHRLQHQTTVGSSTIRARANMPKFGDNKPYPPMLPEKDEYVVEFEGHDDPLHAQNWTTKKK